MRPMHRIAYTLVCLLSATLVGCSDDDRPTTGDGSPPAKDAAVDQPASDGQSADGGATDGRATDSAPADSSVDAAPVKIRFERVFASVTLDQPLDLQRAPKDADHVYVVERPGRIHRINLKTNASSVFLDIRGRVEDGEPEEGLIGLAFHPKYDQNGFFYVNYTVLGANVIARFVKKSGSNAADPASEQQVLRISQPFRNHNGGGLVFGPDGMLYGGIGDGGSGNDPFDNGQKKTNLLGTIFRIDVDKPGGGRNYGIPTDNPFVGEGGGVREEIWAYGLRNPWRISFDGATGWLWIGDVGQKAWEEIDIAKKGGLNFGWRIMEGEVCRPAGPPTCDSTGLEPPVHVYPQVRASSITGGMVYRGAKIPSLVGWYIYADAIDGRVWRFKLDDKGNAENVLIADTEHFIVSFGVDSEGEMYYVDFNGGVFKITI
jgi:glucose/arabinose dehydrogenase